MPGPGPTVAIEAPRRASLLERVAALSFLLLAVALPWSIAPISITVVLCAVLTLAVWWSPGGIRWPRTPMTWSLVGWIVALAIASAFALDPARSWPRVTKGLLFAIVPLAFYHARDPRVAKRALIALLVSAVPATIYALARFVHDGAVFPARVKGLVGHALTYGGQATLLATIAMALIARGPSRAWRIGAAAFLALLAPALAGTYTRSAWIATGVAACVILARTRARLVPVVLAVAAIAIALAPSSYRARALSSFDTKSVWNVERLHMWDAGLRMWRDHPITGVGLQDLSELYRRYRSPLAYEDHGHLHNIVVQVGATMGLVGLLALAGLLIGLFRTGGHRWRAPLPRSLASALRLAAVASLVAMVVAGMFEWNLGDEELVDFLCVVVGMGYAASLWDPEPVEPTRA
ncbi:MAG TPA: O-antigen ligase family protein [Candidatus Eisenbacteria bacterium]|jgi:O-antigen ligase|nr:O-antigen ligase family protein [Candidatus Eisenbacteria bacterium]